MESKPTRLRRSVLLALAMALPLFTALPAAAAGYPDKPVRWIVPFPPGGAMDSIARTLGEQMQRKLGQPFVIENKPGAGGNLGLDAVAKSPADGYTMVITSIGIVTNPYLYPKVGYNAQRDFVPVAQLAVVPNVLVVNPQRVPARSVGALIKLAKSSPGKFTYASAGNGTSIHLAGELFVSMTGVEIMHVPYKGSGPAVSDLLGGQVDMMFDSVSSARPHVQSGKLVALGVTTTKRSAALPEVPTIEQEGVKGYGLAPWFGVLMPKGTPREVVATMNKALNEAMQQTDVKARLFVLGAEPIGGTPEAFAATLAGEDTKWAKIIRERKIQAD